MSCKYLNAFVSNEIFSKNKTYGYQYWKIPKFEVYHEVSILNAIQF